MKKVIWKTLETTLGAGETITEREILLEKGERIVAAVSTPSAPNAVVNLGLFENGQEVSPAMSLPFWERSNSGQYLDGFKPIEYKGGGNITARVSTRTPLAADVQLQVVFGIIQIETTC